MRLKKCENEIKVLISQIPPPDDNIPISTKFF